MNEKATIILMSHGNMAQETLASAQMIVGNIGSTKVISMTAEDGLEGTTAKLQDSLSGIGVDSPILIIADLKGGTPCNTAMMQLKNYPNLRVLSGLNLAIVIEALMSPLDGTDELQAYLTSIGKESVMAIELPELDEEEEYED